MFATKWLRGRRYTIGAPVEAYVERTDNAVTHPVFINMEESDIGKPAPSDYRRLRILLTDLEARQLAKRLLETAHDVGFAAEFATTYAGKETWAGNALVFETEEEAKIYALDLLCRWTAPHDFRVVQIEKKPTHRMVEAEDGKTRCIVPVEGNS